MGQRDKILEWLQTGSPITPLGALQKFNCLRLGARIKELREMGYAIVTDMVAAGTKRVARYTLLKDGPRLRKAAR